MRIPPFLHKPWLIGAVLLGTLAAAVAATHRKEAPMGRTLPLSSKVVDSADHEGLSDLALAPDGTLYAVAERQREILALNKTGALVRKVYRLEGVPRGLDTESLAALDSDHFAIGAERLDAGRSSDDILFAERVGDTIIVRDRRALPYALFGLRAEANRGIEGLCAVGATLLASLEQVKEKDGARLAPLARWDDASKSWTPFYVRLTSNTGKLSGITCHTGDNEIEVLAIERHYGVGRLVRFAIPRNGPGQTVTATVEANLLQGLDDQPNFEGLVRNGSTLWLINDNSSGMVRGKSALWVFTL